MNYELAKELKDAGFPYPWVDTFEEQSPWNHPALSELIEACREGMFSLTKEDDIWRAFLIADITPEEAVARLWLALQ